MLHLRHVIEVNLLNIYNSILGFIQENFKGDYICIAKPKMIRIYYLKLYA